MADWDEIQSYASEVGARFNPHQVVLFGSHVRGEAGADSDVDLLVVMDYRGKPSQQALAIRRAVRKSFPLDLVVQSPADVRRRLDQGDPFIREGLAQGRVLYEGDRT